MGWELDALDADLVEVTRVMEMPGMERFWRLGFFPVLLAGPGIGSVKTNSTSFLFLLYFMLACLLWPTLAR